jgi:hypothetical protein
MRRMGINTNDLGKKNKSKMLSQLEDKHFQIDQAFLFTAYKISK